MNNIDNAEKITVYPNKSISLNAKASKYIYLWVADKDPGNYKVNINVSSIGSKVVNKTVTTDTIIQSKVQSCIKEGEKIYTKPDTTGYTTKCCDGLTASYAFKTNDSKICGINPGGAGICIKCGDGVCSKYENICNCPGDCKSTSNQPPVIDGVSGPTQLEINRLGTWTVKAHDPENGYLGYSVKWGDEVSGANLQTIAPAAKQTTTFTHTYSKAGTYTVEFTVTDDK
ncbi:MAG: PKD domain-containing protein, partial [Candidatus Parcubacteria bacterium]|nr:PKD domain-containing protein [Candidatus Parcubacteria bacterium]